MPHTAQSMYTCDDTFCKVRNETNNGVGVFWLPPPSEERRVPLPGQIHAAVREAGGRIEVLSAGSQNQVKALVVAEPVLGFPFWGCADGGVDGTSTTLHQLPSKADVLQATGTQKAFCKYLGKRRKRN